MDILADRWLQLLRRVGEADPTTVESAGTDLLSRWAEPHRQYHTVEHLATVLSIVERLGGDDAVALAAWYHDAVYDPRAAPGGNEEASAELAARQLPELGVPPDAVAEVCRLVRLTAGHTADPGDRNAAVLCDADLAILATDEPAYDAYAAAIRREYAHVPDDAFRLGRAAVLRHLLALPQLYRHPETPADWENRARANLARELTHLTHLR
jgi:predicted metal-dependent HD superfamily phosphohydrolase